MAYKDGKQWVISFSGDYAFFRAKKGTKLFLNSILIIFERDENVNLPLKDMRYVRIAFTEKPPNISFTEDNSNTNFMSKTILQIADKKIMVFADNVKEI